ncbi:hypothetical protein [Candidatus Magnetominusculus xianensis]|uniref:Uncharacterized protein n=1 Tax=Candidatus Magnetominusculus xianensis TaxID=1748249 RepID=A0ABR5SJS7_9BACT|nr:hypothetical protein [Candidatus Magnetominusculus xianensis]KWT95091.1 hypothetical protein ASN18_0019 [Candidatus Magnetominusculus xianensis]MBF0402739.1 hypothetical protein [Nitrospirota bacterium]
MKNLDLSDLGKGEIPALTRHFGSILAECAAVCLEEQGNYTGVGLKVEGDYEELFKLTLPEVTQQMRNCYNDREVATEHGAYGVAIMLILSLTEYTIIERSRKGTAFDYWLGKKGDNYLFNNRARLEVSGIRKGDDSDIINRSRIKIIRLIKQIESIPTFIIIVEFSKPKSNIKKL